MAGKCNLGEVAAECRVYAGQYNAIAASLQRAGSDDGELHDAYRLVNDARSEWSLSGAEAAAGIVAEAAERTRRAIGGLAADRSRADDAGTAVGRTLRTSRQGFAVAAISLSGRLPEVIDTVIAPAQAAADALSQAGSSTQLIEPIRYLDDAMYNAGQEASPAARGAAVYLHDYAVFINGSNSGGSGAGNGSGAAAPPRRRDDVYVRPAPAEAEHNAAGNGNGSTSGLDDYRMIMEAIKSLQADAGKADQRITEDDLPYAGKYIAGPLKAAVDERIAGLRARLHDIDPSLDVRHLMPSMYLDHDSNFQISQLDDEQHEQLRALAESHRSSAEQVLEALQRPEHDGQIAPGVLANPPFRRSDESLVACAISAFRMVYDGITGHDLSEKNVRDALIRTVRTGVPRNETMLNILHTDQFKEQHGQDVRTVSFHGMSLAKIQEITDKLRGNGQDRSVYLVTNLASESAYNSNAWHNVVVTGIDKDNVTAHDPAEPNGADRQMTKTQFFKRWAPANNSGYIVVAQKR